MILFLWCVLPQSVFVPLTPPGYFWFPVFLFQETHDEDEIRGYFIINNGYIHWVVRGTGIYVQVNSRGYILDEDESNF